MAVYYTYVYPDGEQVDVSGHAVPRKGEKVELRDGNFVVKDVVYTHSYCASIWSHIHVMLKR
jgi:hypothetical protein